MAKIRVGLLSFSDGRASVHNNLKGYIQEQADSIRKALEATGEVEILEASDIVWSNALAKKLALEVKKQLPDVLVFNVPIFAFPNFSVVSESVLRLPTVVVSNVNGSLPGLGGLQAASNMLHQCGYPCEKVWGNMDQPEVVERCMQYLRAAYAVNELKGEVFGLFGGRSIGMGSGTANPDLWQDVFGVDVDHVDQTEILRLSPEIPEEKVQHAFEWLQEKTNIRYDNDKLTEESLKAQIRNYYATKQICEEKGFAFAAVKCHTELSANYCAQCLTTAFFNDPYDWDGPKDTLVCACEADSEAALTMQIMKLLSGEPVSFADFRYYDKAQNLFYFCNCGSMATWYSRRSEDPAENLKSVNLMPLIPKYTGKGAHVEFIAREGRMTFGRLNHELGKFTFTVFTGTAKEMPKEALKATCEQWPHIFVVPDASYDDIIENYACNHIHAIAGDYVNEIRKFCELTGVEFKYIQ